MDYSPVKHNYLSASFNKIGSEIDDIFSSLDIFHDQTDLKALRGSSVDILDNKDQELTKLTDFTCPRAPFSDRPSFTTTEDVDNSAYFMSRSPSVERLKQSTPLKPYSLNNPSFVGVASSDQTVGARAREPDRELYYNTDNQYHVMTSRDGMMTSRDSMMTSRDGVITSPPKSKNNADSEKKLCLKHREDISNLRARILELTDKIQACVEDRNKVLFKLEAAIRELNTQGFQKDGLCQRIQELNQKLLDGDFEINQLKNQIGLLNKQLDSSQNIHQELLAKLQYSYQEIEKVKEDRDKFQSSFQKSGDQYRNIVQKYNVLEKIHGHCGTVKNTDTIERRALLDRVDDMTFQMNKMQTERNALIDNLGKVHKLVDKLERKATDKIHELCRELETLKDLNGSLKEGVQEKDAMLSVNRTTIRDLESKLCECERQVEDVKRTVEDNRKLNQEAVQIKNKKIKILSLKVKQLQTRLQTQSTHIDVLTETNQTLEGTVSREKLKCRSFTDDTSAKDTQIIELETRITELKTELETQVEVNNSHSAGKDALQSDISQLVKHRDSIQVSFEQLEDCNKTQACEMEELKRRLAGGELTYETNLHEMVSRLSGKEKKMSKLREGLNRMVSQYQDTDLEIQELRGIITNLTTQLETLQQHSDIREQEFVEDLNEKTLQLEQYKDVIDTLQVSETSKVLEKEYDFVSTTLKLRELEAENEHLRTALQRTKDKHVKLRRDFSNKLLEQNNIIDNCVDKGEAEKQIAELQAFYEAKVSELSMSSR